MADSHLKLRRFATRAKHFTRTERQKFDLLLGLRRGRMSPRRMSGEISRPVDGEYLISSEKGVFHLSGNRVVNIFPLDTFGLSVEDGKIYLAVWTGECQFVLKSELDFRGGSCRLSGLTCLHEGEQVDRSGRVHQLHVRDGIVALANTKRNAITRLNAVTGQKIDDIYPLLDASGFPITTDHNHINSVYIANDIILFVLHDGGQFGAMVGFVAKQGVVGAGYIYRGLHDLIPTERGLIYSDTYGAPDNYHLDGGSLRIGSRKLTLHREGELGYMVRGVAESGTELVVGHSRHGRREDRFKGFGGLIIYRDGEFCSFERLPFSQVNDIVRIDGRKTDDQLMSLTFEQAETMLRDSVGDIIYRSGVYYDQVPGEWHMSARGEDAESSNAPRRAPQA